MSDTSSFLRVVAAAAGVCVGISGCTAPNGNGGGRIDVTQTTSAEANSHQVNLTDLRAFADSVAEQLVTDLGTIPELNGQYRVNLIYGDTNNKTDMQTRDIEMVSGEIRSKLLNSRIVNEHVRFLSNRARIDTIRAREAPQAHQPEDLLGEHRNQSASAPSAPNPDYTYYLNSDIYQTSRGNVSDYSMSFHLASAKDGVLIWESKSYGTKKAGN
jgi:Peptidoglycan-synthase activator LpoB